EVIRVVLSLETLQPVVRVRSVGRADPFLAFVFEEVDVHRLMPRLECRPERAHPLALLVETVCSLGGAADVVGERRLAPAEGRLALIDTRDRSAHLPDWKRRERRVDLQRALHR